MSMKSMVGHGSKRGKLSAHSKIKTCYDRDCLFTLTCRWYDADSEGASKGKREGLICLDYESQKYEALKSED